MENIPQMTKSKDIKENDPLLGVIESSPKVEVLSAIPKDAQGIRELEYETWMRTYVGDKSKITESDIEWYFKTFKKFLTPQNIEKLALEIEGLPDDHHALVAKDESGKIVGFAWLMKRSDSNELGAIYIHPEYQGIGLGKKIWNEAGIFFDPQKDITLTVQENNMNAIEFYKNLGFVDTGKKIENLTFPSGAIFSEIEMIKKVVAEAVMQVEQAEQSAIRRQAELAEADALLAEIKGGNK